MENGVIHAGANVLWFVLLAVVAVVLAIRGAAAAADRRWALYRFAAAAGLRFDPDPSNACWMQYEGFDPFGQGKRRQASNRISGQRGDVWWEMFDYTYRTGSGDNEHTEHAAIVVAKVPLGFPRLMIRPEGLWDRFKETVGLDADHISFESEQFSRRYHVTCSDRKLAYDIIHPQMMEYLLGERALHWQLGGPVIMLWLDKWLKPAELTAAMAIIEGFVKRIPEFVRQEIGTR